MKTLTRTLKIRPYEEKFLQRIGTEYYRYRGFDIKLEPMRGSTRRRSWNIYREGRAMWLEYFHVKYACEQIENYRAFVYHECLEVEKEKFS